MRRTVFIACLMFLPLFAGCSLISDVIFGVFGSGYTGGGESYADKKSHYDQYREPPSAHYKPWNDDR